MNAPKVAVIVCTHNMVQYLPTSLDSVLAIIYPHYQVVVVDDGSTDETETLIREHYANRIIYVQQENKGLFAARNAGIDAVPDADYYSIADADDIVHPLKIWDEVALMERFPDVVVCFSNILRFERNNIDPRPIWNVSKMIGSNTVLWGKLDNPIEKITKYMSFTSVSTLRATTLHKIGRYDATLQCSGDLDLAIRLSRIGEIGFINKVRYLWRREGQGMSQYMRNRIAIQIRIFDKVRNNAADFTNEELQLLHQMEKNFLKKALRATATGKTNAELRSDICHRLLQDKSIRDIALVAMVQCAAWLGVAKIISQWRHHQSRKISDALKHISLQEILNDLSPCFEMLHDPTK